MPILIHSWFKWLGYRRKLDRKRIRHFLWRTQRKEIIKVN